MGLEYADPNGDARWNSQESLRKAIRLNWNFEHFEFGYSLGQLPEPVIRLYASRIFAEPFGREWWEFARRAWDLEAITRRERRFFEIVDHEYRQAVALATTQT
jgi:hypothetical protein